MRGFSSFRARFLAGALIAAAGLLLLTHVASVLVVVGAHAFHGGVLYVLTLIAIGAAAVTVGLWQSRTALASLDDLRARLAKVHQGAEPRLGGRYPTEVQPLVDDLNALLEHRDVRVREAVAKAGDLAHGLKTPLAVLAHEADRAAQAGHAELATVVRDQITRMQRHLDYHLAHARAAASGAIPGSRSDVLTSADGLARTLGRLHADRGLTIDVRVPATHAVQTQREDLDEMLGNLLDNACKWARSRVHLSSEASDGHVTIAVEDDGPGLPAAMRAAVLARGVRADEAADGWGLGLAIVRDLAEVYGGSVALEAGSPGGLRACLRLPATE